MKTRAVTLVAIMLMFLLPILIIQVQSQVSANANQAPVASFAFDPEIPTPSETIVFNASSSYDPDGQIIRYTWNFGDGSIVTETDSITTHSYPSDGNYTVELTVTDNGGSTGVAVAIVPVNCVTFFRVVYMGTLVPVSNVEVTTYYYDGSAWVKAPTGKNNLEILYDRTTQPDLADTNAEKYRNPGYTASLLRCNSSNIGWDVHRSEWKIFFRFKILNSIVASWPNNLTGVYCYENGRAVAHSYVPGHLPYYDAMAGTIVIKANDIWWGGINPSQGHPIIVSLSCPPPQQNYYLKVKTNPIGITTIPGEGWYGNGTDKTLTGPTYVNVSSNLRYRFSYWDVDGTSRGTGVNPITVQMNANHTATAHYVTQYSVTFSQTGLSSDATGTIVTVNGNAKTLSNLPYILWVDSGTSVTYSCGSLIASTQTGKQYRLSTVTGPTSPITVTGASTVTGNYVVQYSITFSQTGLDSTATGTIVSVNGNGKVFTDLPITMWFDSGSSVTYSYTVAVPSSTSGKRFRLSNVNGPVSPITVIAPVTVIGNYVTQYGITFTHTGLDSTAAGTVLTANGDAKLFTDLPLTLWADSGSSVTYLYSNTIMSTTSGKQFKLVNVNGQASPITVTNAATVTGNYKTQYQIVFDQSGVGTDFTGTVVTIDSINYNVNGLPSTPFWWDQGSTHGFTFASPLVANASKQYNWTSTSGLSSARSGTLTVTASGSVVGNYAVLSRVTFDQLGISSDFAGTVVTVDGTPYGYGNLPTYFSWSLGSIHSFAFQSPLVVTANSKRYVWTSTSGLSSSQSGPIAITTFGSVIGNYKTQYYLSLPPNPPGITTPTGSGWYDRNTLASISTDMYVPGGSRYRFNGWVTEDMSEIADPSSPSTTVLIDKSKIVTATYVHQYLLTFKHAGLSSDTNGIVATINGTTRTYLGLPYALWADVGSTIPYSFSSTVTSTTPGKQYRLNSITGPSSPVTVSADVNITGHYVTQYYLTVDTPYATPSGQGWYDNGATAYAILNAGTVNHGNGTRHVFLNWNGDASGTDYVQSNPLTMTGPKTATAGWKTQHYLTLATNPVGVNNPTGAGWYDANTLATVSTDAYEDIIPDSSRYRFNGWSTANMSEITNPMFSPTTVLMDKPKTVTALYAIQYKITFGQTGVNSDFPGSVVLVDDVGYGYSELSIFFWWDAGSTHNFAFQSPLVVAPDAKRYMWTSTTGLSTGQEGTITVSVAGSATGNYKTQYYLTVTSAHGSPTPPAGWFDAGASITASINSPVPGSTGIRYVCTGWTGTGSVPASGSATSVTFTLNQQSLITWNWKTQYYLSVATDPPGIATIPGENWYDSSTNVQLTAPSVSGHSFLFWTVDGASQGTGVNVINVAMGGPHTSTAHYKFLSAFTATLDPMTATIQIGQSVLFSSTISGGTAPFSYQWYLDGHLVSGASSSTWNFISTATGTHYVSVKVTDAHSEVAQSETAHVAVVSVPVGGYSVSLLKQTPLSYTAAYAALMVLFGAMLTVIKRKRK